MSEIEDIGEIVEEEVSEMTDEEKAKDFTIKLLNVTEEKFDLVMQNYNNELLEENVIMYVYNSHLAGLTEGRKEVTYMKAEEYDQYLDACRKNRELKKENAELRKGLTKTRIDKCVKKHLTSDMTKKEIPTIPCYEVNDCWLCNIYKEATDEQH